jgi:hypothetical protein
MIILKYFCKGKSLFYLKQQKNIILFTSISTGKCSFACGADLIANFALPSTGNDEN